MTKIKLPTKEQILKASDTCRDARGILQILFPDAFDGNEWEDVSEEITFVLRSDGVLQINHKDICRGHYVIGQEWYWVDDDEYKEVLDGRRLTILKKKNSKDIPF